jgi:hypothetical protein
MKEFREGGREDLLKFWIGDRTKRCHRPDQLQHAHGPTISRGKRGWRATTYILNRLVCLGAHLPRFPACAFRMPAVPH